MIILTVWITIVKLTTIELLICTNSFQFVKWYVYQSENNVLKCSPMLQTEPSATCILDITPLPPSPVGPSPVSILLAPQLGDHIAAGQNRREIGKNVEQSILCRKSVHQSGKVCKSVDALATSGCPVPCCWWHATAWLRLPFDRNRKNINKLAMLRRTEWISQNASLHCQGSADNDS